MAYNVIDAYGSVISIESSVVSGSSQRQAIAIASFLTAVPTTPTGNQSVSGTVQLTNSSVSGIGIFNTNHIGNGSMLVVVPGSVATAPSPASVSGVGIFNTNHIGNGSILVVIPGSVATAPSPASVSGVGLFNVNHVGNGSILANIQNSSVAVLQGTNPWVVGNSSVMLTPGINTIGSVATLQGTMPWIVTVQNNSVAGTYAEDSAHTSAERGIFILGVRNDTVSSFTSANADYNPIATDSQGRVLVKIAPEEARVQSVIATTAGTTSLLAAGGAGLRTYITDAFVTNTSSTATLVSFLDGDNSVMGRTIAPATGGSNMVNLATPMRTGGFNQIVQVQMATITSTLGITALGYKGP